jgi:hypothetical protein
MAADVDTLGDGLGNDIPANGVDPGIILVYGVNGPAADDVAFGGSVEDHVTRSVRSGLRAPVLPFGVEQDKLPVWGYGHAVGAAGRVETTW